MMRHRKPTGLDRGVVDEHSGSAKHCLNCSYIIDGLPEHRCPECGAEFDPGDPTTYQIKKPARTWWSILLAPGPVGTVIFLLLVLLVPIIALLISLIIPALQRLW
ncbi:MAG: hypothetical protein GY842_07710 [bacterium]|nr:hypothetical protein [bacterium]